MAFSRSVLFLLCVLTLSVPTGHSATVTGAVKGPDRAPFKGAFVQARNARNKVMMSVLSDKQGHYRMDNLPAGEYRFQVRAVGYTADPKSGVQLTADQSTSFDFSLEKGMVHWSDLSMYQGERLFPDAKGKDVLTGRCFACHGFESRMASVIRDEDGWRDRVRYMKESMHFFLGGLGFTDQNESDVAAYINSLFGQNSVLPKSPTEMPLYKEVARGAFKDEAMKIVYVEYDLPGPNRMPWSAAPDKDGNFWMPYYGRANMIGRLNPRTAEVEEFRVPNEGTAGIHSAVPAADGSVWLTEQGSDKLGRWDPKTRTITEYQDKRKEIPGKEDTIIAGSKHTVRVDSRGYVWATGGPLSRFDPETGKFTDFPEIPSSYGIALDNDGNCWFAEFTKDGKIGKIDAKTLKVTKWTPPTPDPRPRRIQVDTDGTVWFAEFAAGKIARFDPKTETFKEYQLPGAKPTPYALGIDKNHDLWYASEYMDVVGRLDPKTGQVTEFPFPQPENTMREFFYDSQGRMWFATPTNNKVGYFYLAGSNAGAGN
jgi:virginiamycin B lyase